MNKNIFMMTAGRSLSYAGKGLIFQVILVTLFLIFTFVYTPNIELTSRSVSFQMIKSESMKTLQYYKVQRIMLYVFGACSMVNMTLVGISLLKAGKCIQRHWKYFGVEH
jgi:hypothetical protein